MALARYTATSSLLGGTKYAQNCQENTTSTFTESKLGNDKMIAGKTMLGKTRAGSSRAALGNISNRAGTTSSHATAKPLIKPTIKDVTSKPKTITTRARSARETVEKKEVVNNKAVIEERVPSAVPACPVSPAPMDISVHNSSTTSFTTKPAFLPPHINDIDAEDAQNPQLVSEYVNEIYAYMRHLEEKYSVKPHYLETSDVNGRMRGILIDWLVQVHLRFHLLQETLYLTVAIIDRYLQEESVPRSKLQLVGVTSMLIASKYEEMYAPEIADFVFITDRAYTAKDIRKMECLILKTLDFSLGRPLPLHFLRRNSKAGEVDAQKHTLAKYISELTIVDYELAHIVPSHIAAAALCLSIKVLDGSEWTDTLAHYSNYEEDGLAAVMKRMACLVLKAGTGKLTAIKTKYTTSKLLKISTLAELKGRVIQNYASGNVE